MSTENPYQSPQHDSTPEPESLELESLEVNRVYQKYPTWRFWVLTLICIPGFAASAVAIWVVNDLSSDPLLVSLFSILFLAFAILFLVASGMMYVYWRAPAHSHREAHRGAVQGRRRIIFLVALCVLAILAAPSAFVSVCTPISFPLQGANLPFGVIAGLFGALLPFFIARGLWLDAIGRPRKPVDQPPQRPMPRLQARRPSENE